MRIFIPYLFICFLFSTLTTSAQEKNKKERKVKFQLSFDSRNSVFAGNSVKMNGLKIGVEIKNKHRTGFGFYNLREPVIVENIDNLENQLELTFGYNTIFYEYVFYKNSKWEFTVPLQFGGGELNVKLTDKEGEQIVDEKGDAIGNRTFNFSALSFAIEGEYKIWPWLGIGLGTGYRMAFAVESNTKKALSAPFYAVKLKIFFSPIIDKIFKKKKNGSDN